MRGYELEQERALRREELARIWEQEHPDKALTMERLLRYVRDLGGGNRSRLLQQAVITRGLAAGVADLLAPSSVVQKMEEEIRAALPETSEPDRHVPVTVTGYSLDRVWKAREAVIDAHLGR